MKRLLMTFILGVMLLGSAAASYYRVLLNNTTAPGAGQHYELGSAFSSFTCTVTWSGTTPTNTIVALEGSINNTTWAALATETVTATGQTFHVVNKPVTGIRGNYIGKSGGDGTTAVSMICMPGRS